MASKPNPEKSFLRLPEVRARVGLSTPQIYKLISQGKFPRQVKLGERASAWLSDEIDAWIDERIAASRPEAPAAA